MNPKPHRGLAVSSGISILLTCSFLFGGTQQVGSARRIGVSEQATPATIIQYVRDRFEVPDAVKVDAEPVHPSPFPRLYETVVTVDDGRQKRASNVFISKDALCFVVGDVLALNGATNAEIMRCVRDAAKLPPTAEITVGTFASTAYPGFLKSTVTVRDGTKVQIGEVFITLDRRVGILGLVLPFRRDFVERLIDLKDQPSAGSGHARVTIVEYADLECPGCAAFQKFLETEFLPKYGEKVRIVFKEFPLSFHPWSNTAAIANECAYQMDPSKFLNYRRLIFGNQETISSVNVHDRLLSLGEQAGLDPANLGSCLDTKATLGRIEACRNEALALGVMKTPTFFINGRIVVGPPPPETFYKIVDEALAKADKRN